MGGAAVLPLEVARIERREVVCICFLLFNFCNMLTESARCVQYGLKLLVGVVCDLNNRAVIQRRKL